MRPDRPVRTDTTLPFIVLLGLTANIPLAVLVKVARTTSPAAQAPRQESPSASQSP
jgi:hypothetical protein